jgi:predicted RNA binding protein YcfA (HicA-like mRNA interferase family)
LSEKITPLSRDKLIRKLCNVGFEGPIAGGKHSCMIKSKQKIIIPNPHRGDISIVLIKKIIRQLRLTNEQWNKL